MNTSGENTPRRAGASPRRKLTALLAVALFSGITVALVLATGVSEAGTGGGGRARLASAAQPQDSTATTPVVKPRAGHSDYLVGLTRASLRAGFGKETVLILEPGRGPGREAVAGRLRELAAGKDNPFGARLTARGLKPAPSADDRNTTFVGPDSVLKVSDDGTKFRFRGNIDDRQEVERARAGGRMIEKDELEKIGRRFVGEALRDFVKLGAEETLTFLGAKYLRDEVIGADGKEQGGAEVVASIAVFGREVRGVPVIGDGSKVAVWFANDRQPVGFDVDWPVYNVLKTSQGVLPRERLFERVRATTVSPEGGERGGVARFECGYVDLGAAKRTTIQSGCAIHYAGRNADGTIWARVEYVPAGDKVLADAKWPLARLIAGGRTINTDTPEFVKYSTTTKLPDAAPPPTGGDAKPTTGAPRRTPREQPVPSRRRP